MTQKIEAYSMWEVGQIGMTLTHHDGGVYHFDMNRQEAEVLIHQLIGSCANYDALEQMCKEHDDYTEYCEHMRTGAEGSCARCEGT